MNDADEPDPRGRELRQELNRGYPGGENTAVNSLSTKQGAHGGGVNVARDVSGDIYTGPVQQLAPPTITALYQLLGDVPHFTG